MALMPRDKKRTEVFVCDFCGSRKRLPRGERHWCEECKQTPPVEMHLTRSRLHHQRPVPTKPAEPPRDPSRFDPLIR